MTFMNCTCCQLLQAWGGGSYQVIMQAVQQQSEQLLSIMLSTITELGPHGMLCNAPQELGWIYCILITVVVHLQRAKAVKT